MKPILFNTEMVKALLADRKTVTRRVVKPQPKGAHKVFGCNEDEHTFELLCGNGGAGGIFVDWAEPIKAPLWPGDILYVRETWQEVYETEHNVDGSKRTQNIRDLISNFDDISKVEAGISHDCATAAMEPRMKYYVFKASDIEYTDPENGLCWRPSIHMPKEAARIFLRVTDVRVERLQEISADSCAMEGVPLYFGPAGNREKYYRDCFAAVWNSALKPKDLPLYGWEANPWVWIIEFERISREEALL